MKKLLAILLLLFLSLPLSAQEKIPLLISDHHADHLKFFYEWGFVTIGTLIVVDAHADTVANEYSEQIAMQIYENPTLATTHTGNHNWIQPLTIMPVQDLIWVSVMQGSARSDKLEGFRKSTAAWSDLHEAIDLSVEELRTWKFVHVTPFIEKLFVSIDLDFFYNENYSPDDVPAVLDVLFGCLSRWQGKTAWAICLSRPWLPDDRYAWQLLERCLQWLVKHPEFAAPEITLFDNNRTDTSANAQAFRAEGRKVPALRETDAPEHIMSLIGELQKRK